MDRSLDFRITDARRPSTGQRVREQLLAEHHLQAEKDIQYFVEAWDGVRLAGCAGLAGNLVKCVVTDAQWRGINLTGRLLSEIESLAARHGVSHLFLATLKHNSEIFRRCGFWPVTEDSRQTVLMENLPGGLHRYCQSLKISRRPGKQIAAIVMNANPFTLGHRFLAALAARQNDWLHLFLVREESSFFPYTARLAMVREGVADLPNVTVHEGSAYMISRATFPGYFLKEKPQIDHAWSEIDLTIFRDHIAPALGITHRYIGSEPFCSTTRSYNRTMHRLFQGKIQVIETARCTSAQAVAISASEVRRLLHAKRYDLLRHHVPASTYAWLETHMIAPQAPSVINQEIINENS